MNKQLKLLAIAAIFASYLEAATIYEPGPEGSEMRIDTIRLGSAGGFNGFVSPSASVKALYINLMPSGGTVESNTSRTFSAYDGTGTMPYLPSTVKDVYIQGDATDWATLVLGNSAHTMYGPTLAPSAYGLPTPASGTTVHFKLTHRPSVMPELWFQGDLLAKSRVVIEPGYQDPYLATVLPKNGGNIILGAPVETEAGFSTALNNCVGAVTIQRHPKVAITDAATEAVLTLGEDTVFPCSIYGISMAGAYDTTFNKNAYLVDPASDFANAHVSIGNCELEVFASARDLPAFADISTAAGSISKFEKASKAKALPTLVPALKA